MAEHSPAELVQAQAAVVLAVAQRVAAARMAVKLAAAQWAVQPLAAAASKAAEGVTEE